MPETPLHEQAQSDKNGLVKNVVQFSLGTVENIERSTTKVVSTPKKHKVASPSRRGGWLWRVPVGSL